VDKTCTVTILEAAFAWGKAKAAYDKKVKDNLPDICCESEEALFTEREREDVKEAEKELRAALRRLYLR
jgi:hypothetical protein